MDNRKNRTMPNLSQEEVDRVYRMQQRTYWEADFVNRCISRRMEGVGICNLPYASLADEKVILDVAYEMYCGIEDCNVAYNDTLDAVVDGIEQYIANGTFNFLGCQEPGDSQDGRGMGRLAKKSRSAI